MSETAATPKGTVLKELEAHCGKSVWGLVFERDLAWGYVKRESVVEVLTCLKNDCGFNVLMDLSCVDYLNWEEKSDRFEIIYNVYSTERNERVILRAPVPERDPRLPSASGIWPAVNWYEREVWDMFGARFDGHPNLKRILMYESFKGHPLRKDYPYNKRQPLIGPQN